ncbi:FAD-dependent oxidoreductase [Microbulbifer sp. OS29]|uniref:FAD-dependent oxidoreductase n=1 Tax=Microbulbifer okhotskensis TaxID=2926617 RepID=A0A9X2EMM6_9GAMM|nr:FAD-dependent oxidoreductase [Microbulbifer okhotskensis]MCO1334390.1 FAD-dependent oxidoreductase [Microbulbifer okhotskensis]
MTELDNTLVQHSPSGIRAKDSSYPIYVIVGTGPVGVRCAQKLLEFCDEAQIVIYGAETESPYNRVKLSQYLSSHVELEELDNPILGQNDHRLAEYIDRKITSIDRTQKTVTDAAGNIQPYSKLIIATGSNPTIPGIQGADLPGVYPFRSLRNTNDLLTLRERNADICVIGAGALGLEAATALKTPKNSVTLQSRGHLLSGLLGEEGEGFLKSALTALGVTLKIGDSLSAIKEWDGKRTLIFDSGEALSVDAIVLCTGIQPEISLAEQCGLNTVRGIVVNEWMQTSDPDIYAVGECAEFDQTVYQLVRPGYEQAESCCSHIHRNYGGELLSQPYSGSYTDIQLKIAHIPCGIMGDVSSDNGNAAADAQSYVYKNRFKGIYRRLFIKGENILGASYIGSWDEAGELRQAVAQGQKISLRSLKQFENEGRLFAKKSGNNLKDFPDSYLVCQCNSVTKGELCKAISDGKRNLNELQQATTAGSVCGSCRPLMAELLDAPVPNLVMRHSKGIWVTSALSLILITLAFLMPSAPISDSVQTAFFWEKLWYDNFWKQLTGYTILAMCLFTAALSIRKRWKKLNLGHVDHWRYAHSITGLIALVALAMHSGFRLGENLNLALMLVFLTATATGSLVGVFMARNHHWTDLKLREHRKWWSRVHYALLWALPVLLGYHIFAVYYF